MAADENEINFGAALQPTQDHPQNCPSQTTLGETPASPEPKRGRGRPKKITQPQDPKPAKRRGRPKKGSKPQKPSINKNIYLNKEDYKYVLLPEIVDSAILKELIDINMTNDFSEKELKFLEYYLPGEMKQEDAVRLAGYTSTCDRYLRKIAQKIVQKYESRTEDHRKIMRVLGWGEVRVIQSLIEAATKFKSETVKLNARIALAKCLGMQKEVMEGIEGVQIVIKSSRMPGEQPTTSAQPRPGGLPVPAPKPGTKMIK